MTTRRCPPSAPASAPTARRTMSMLLLGLSAALAGCAQQDAASPTATPAEFVYDGQDHSWSSEATAG
ncbi:hypothetical protein, partial [Deinococcus petrolearius]